MGTIGKDFQYKLIKNFLSKSEIKLLNTYCDIKHRTNINNFDIEWNKNGDTMFYGDPIMEALLLNKQELIEKETNKKLLPTYAFWRMYTKYADLKEHIDRPACEVSVTVSIGNDGVAWPINMDEEPVDIPIGDAVVYLGCDLPHSRGEFKGDWHAQTFLHYVDAEGSLTDNYRDKRNYFGIKKNDI
jgi:hypothetical protein